MTDKTELKNVMVPEFLMLMPSKECIHINLVQWVATE